MYSGVDFLHLSSLVVLHYHAVFYTAFVEEGGGGGTGMHSHLNQPNVVVS